ncbi:hypothetical protein ACFIOZ_17745 [Vreelandella sp. F11]|uniref:hypothetical protein n=1 Tax=Vreelandella sp. F11 TaxID=3394751 RepID=UPI0036D928C3
MGGAYTIGIANRRLHRRLVVYTGLVSLPPAHFLDAAGLSGRVWTWLLRLYGKKLLPAEMVEWSKPLPKEQWAKPVKSL